MLPVMAAFNLVAAFQHILSTFAGYYYENEVTKKRQGQYHYPGLQQEYGRQ